MKGINFKEPLVNATIERRKTETRRIITPQPDFFEDGKPFCETDFRIKAKSHVNEDGEHYFEVKPRYNVGDVVYLKEPYAVEDVGCDTFKLTYQFDKTGEFTRFFTSSNVEDADWASIHSAQASMAKSRSGFANKLFMPKWAARHFIRITAVRAERLQEITDEGCIREGIEQQIWEGSFEKPFYVARDMTCPLAATPREAYAALIDQINGRGTWDSNPFVWVYGYELYEIGKDDGIKA